MSFFDLNNDKNIVVEPIVYDYRNVVIYKNDVSERTVDTKNKIGAAADDAISGKLIKPKNTFYRVSYPNKSPNLTYAKMNPSSYTATQFYLYGLLHDNITGLSASDEEFVGELVIEHTTSTYSNKKVYTCFLLKRSSSSESNGIDHILEMAKGTYQGKNALDIELNSIIPKQKDCFLYEDTPSTHVFLFTTPIEVNAASADFILNKLSVKTNLFKIFAPNNTTRIQLDAAVEGFETKQPAGNRPTGLAKKPNITPTGLEKKMNNTTLTPISPTSSANKPTSSANTPMKKGFDNEVYIDCQPTGESDETIQAYSIPINSEYSGAKSTIDLMRSSINLLMFLIISITAYFVLPSIYKKIVVDKINTSYPEPSAKGKRVESILSADSTIIGILVGYIIYAFATGISSEVNIGFTYIGFALSIATTALYSIIQMNKTDKAFMTTSVKIDNSYENIYTDPTTNSNYNALTGTPAFIIMLIMTLISTKEYRNNFFFVWVLLFGLTMVFLKLVVFKTLDSAYAKDRGEQTMSNWFFPILIFNTLILTPAVYLSIY